jgi:hypothetical protein
MCFPLSIMGIGAAGAIVASRGINTCYIQTDGVGGPLTASECQLVVVEDYQQRKPSMSDISTIGIDLSKHVFQLRGDDGPGMAPGKN